MAEFFAHSKENCPEEEWEPLEVHLRGVAERAAILASAIRGEELATVAGLWHDVGKYRDGFQRRLRDSTVRCEHSGAGAALADSKKVPGSSQILAAVIAGHHAGLADRVTDAEPVLPGAPKVLADRLRESRPALAEIDGRAPDSILMAVVPPLPAWLLEDKPADKLVCGRRLDFLTRMLFSALVDADRLCTEAFDNPERFQMRSGQERHTPLNVLHSRLEEHLASMCEEVDLSRPISRARQSISDACLARSMDDQGLFSLTVPTGGGKTLSAMRFALAHGVQHGLSRVIVVIPFTSIIEQNAKCYADVFGSANVIEHHSNIDAEKVRATHGEDVASRQDLAAENWDAPIIVTTTVQFIESLFSNHPSRCRKLHNIARSVIILDEVQTLPPEFLAAILDSLTELTERYGCSIVLSTATPPALKKRDAMRCGLEDVQEIAPDPTALARDLRRVRYEWPAQDSAPRAWEELAEELAAHRSVLAIVNKREDARLLTLALRERTAGAEGIFHLSALMCPAHRLEVLARIRESLNAGDPCRVVSTQLVEAGVDLDFPVVYRALSGLDSIVQAAGRCNREGKLSESGRVVVFEPPSRPPRGTLSRAVEATRTILSECAGAPLDPDDPEVQERYFRRFYLASTLDARNIQRDRALLKFATVGHNFRLIDDRFTRSIIIPWGDGSRRLSKLTQALKNPGLPGPPLRELFRAVQPYSVSVYQQSFEEALQAGAIEEVVQDTFALAHTHMNHYCETFGLVIGDDVAVADPSLLCL